MIATRLVFSESCWQVSGVFFDSYWSSPNSEGTGETVMYRFGSVGQVLRNMAGLIANDDFPLTIVDCLLIVLM